MKNADVRIIENLYHSGKMFDVRWRVTTLCNYQCDFCIQGDYQEHLRQAAGESEQMRRDICGRIISLLESLDGYDTVKVSLIGGELTILQDFPDILERLVSCRFPGSIRFDLTTNFSPDSAYFCRLCDIIRNRPASSARSLAILTSFYPAYVTGTAFVRKLREVYTYAAARAGNAVSFSVGVPLLDDADYEGLVQMREDLADTGIRVSPIYIRNYETHVSAETVRKMYVPEKKSVRVTDRSGQVSMYKDIQALGAALEDRDSFCPAGYVCDAGIHNLWIDAFGHVKRCPALGSTMSMGSILDGSFSLLDAPQVCTSDHCSCSQYGRIEKTEP